MNPWAFWWELWVRMAMAPFEAMVAASTPPAERAEAPERSKADFLARRLRTELEVKSVKDLIEGRGRSAKSLPARSAPAGSAAAPTSQPA